MAALTTMLAVGLAAAGTAVQVNQQKKAERNARNAAAKQETKAIEASKLRGQKEQDLQIKLGADNTVTAAEDRAASYKGNSTANSGAAKRVGKVFAGPTASKIGGL